MRVLIEIVAVASLAMSGLWFGFSHFYNFTNYRQYLAWAETYDERKYWGGTGYFYNVQSTIQVDMAGRWVPLRLPQRSYDAHVDEDYYKFMLVLTLAGFAVSTYLLFPDIVLTWTMYVLVMTTGCVAGYLRSRMEIRELKSRKWSIQGREFCPV